MSHIAAPLTSLTRNDVAFVWTNEQQASFEDLRSPFQATPVLAHFYDETATTIHTDASNVGLGAVFIQWQDDVEKVVAYASRTLSRAETNYSATEKECLAVVWAVLKFRPYIEGRPFRVVSDHHSLCWLANLKNPTGHLARWSLRLQEFDMTVIYKSGKQHSDADCLSRAPVEHPGPEDDDDAAFLGAIDPPTLSTQQREEAELQPLLDFPEGRTARKPKLFARGLKFFCLRNDILYKRNFAGNGKDYLLVVPMCLRHEILQACHDEPTAGHLGYARTTARIKQNYYWPKLPATVKQYIRTCRDCQRRKTPPGRPAGLLQPVQVPKNRFNKSTWTFGAPFRHHIPRTSG